MRRCEVFVHKIKAGELTEMNSEQYVFQYDKAYLLNKNNPPVCLNMPLREEPYLSNHLFAYFFNMLSEGENRVMQSQYLRISPDDDFGILLATAQFDTIGAVTVIPIEQ